MTTPVTTLRTIGTFLNGRACSDTLFCVLERAFETPPKKPGRSPEEKASMLMAGGVLQHGYQCGMIWGATLAAGAEVFKQAGSGAKAEVQAILVARALIDAFRKQNKTIDCSDLTEPNLVSSWRVFKYFLLKGGVVGCHRQAVRFAPLALQTAKTALAAEPGESSGGGPVSCAALLARKMGASDRQAIMAAGFAGGIGLCGDACGALGAALWIYGMRELEKDGKLEFRSPRALAIVDEFLKCSGHTLECSQIVGRTFEGVADHARYMQGGGCAKIIDVLAAQGGRTSGSTSAAGESGPR